MGERMRVFMFMLPALASLAAGCAGPDTDRDQVAAGPSPGIDSGSSPSRQPEQAVAAAEPDTYIATLSLMAEAPDGGRAATPELFVEVARDGDARRVSVIMPGVEQVVYLNRAGARYIILPAREQYAELPPGVRGLDLPRLLKPEEVIDFLGHSRGFVKAGEAVVGGRTAFKYLGTGRTDAGGRAEDLSAMTQVYIDKQTGLPLRTEFFTRAAGNTSEGGVKAVTQMRDIRTTAERALFEAPVGYQKVHFEEARRRMVEVTDAAAAIAKSVMGQPGAERAGR